MTPTRTFDLLERALKLFPGNHALAEKVEGEWIFYTSEQYNEIAHQFACGLLEMGFKKGDKIVTATNNRPSNRNRPRTETAKHPNTTWN